MKQIKSARNIFLAAVAIVVVIAAISIFMIQRTKSEKINAYNDALTLISYAETGSRDGRSLISEPGTDFADNTNFSWEYYNKAQSLLEKLGDYQDSQALLTELSYRKGLTESIADTYERLKATTGDEEYIQELLAICEDYIPYCGEFVGIDEYERELRLISDFIWYNGEVVWKPESPNHISNGMLRLLTSSGDHIFFENGVVYPLDASMRITDEWSTKDGIGTITFRNGSINFIAKVEQRGYWWTWCDIDYIKVS